MAKNHVKPSQDELKAQEQAAIAEAEKLKDAPVESDTPPTGEKELEKKPEPDKKPDDGQAEPSEEEKEALRQKLEDEKKKFSASARENQRIYSKNRVMNQALEEANEIPEPTDDEMKSEFNDWELMGETEKMLAKETVISRKWRGRISQAKEQAAKIEKWNESVNQFVEDPKVLSDNPDLEGKTEEFVEFATLDTNISVPFYFLVAAFLHEQSKERVSHKGKMFETGSGGPNDRPTPASDKISLEDARRLRETDYAKYKELLSAGKIDTSL